MVQRVGCPKHFILFQILTGVLMFMAWFIDEYAVTDECDVIKVHGNARKIDAMNGRLWIRPAFQGVLGISVISKQGAVEYCGTEMNVTLPCLLSSETGGVQIEWYFIRPNGSQVRVMRVSSDGKVMTGEYYKGRVRRGDSASLILTNPKLKDAGPYKCEILSTTDDPCCPKAVVNLTVSETGCTRNECDVRMKIHPPYSELKYCVTEETVTLPCTFDHTTITGNKTVQITWSLYLPNGIETVIQASSIHKVTESQNVSGRVDRGTSLVLKNPRYEHSGSYGCRISIAGDTTCCTRGIVNLTITDCSAVPGKDFAVPAVFVFLNTTTIICCIAAAVVNCQRKKTPKHVIYQYPIDIRGLRFTAINCFATIPCCTGAVLLLVYRIIFYPENGFLAAGIVFSIFGMGVAISFNVAMFLKRGGHRCSVNSKCTRQDEESLMPLEVIDVAHSKHDSDSQKSLDAPQENPPVHPDTLRTKKISAEFRINCKKMTQDRFVFTWPYNQAHVSFRQGNSPLFIVGGPGEGKSFILQRLVADSSEEYLPVQCSEPGEVEKYISENKTEEQFMFVLDDTFWKSNTHTELDDQWVKLLEKLQIYLKSHKFLFAISPSVWAKCKGYIGNNPFFPKPVEIRSSWLTEHDKEELLSNYFNKPDKLTQEYVDYTVDIKKTMGFVLCCKLTSETMDQSQSMKDVSDFFSFLCWKLEKLPKLKYDTLCLIALCGGKLSCVQLNGSIAATMPAFKEKLSACNLLSESFPRVSETATELTGVYIKKFNESGTDIYEFSHISLFEKVILMYSRNRLTDLVKYLDSKTAVDIFRPHGWVESEKKFVIYIPENCYTDVAETFTSVCIEVDIPLVFTNPLVTDKHFQIKWNAYLKSTRKEKAAFRRCNGNKANCVMYNAKQAGAEILYSYLKSKIVGAHCKCI